MKMIDSNKIKSLMDSQPPRRSHAERRAESSTRIIEATIRCLDKTGYGSTTIDAVIAEAGVSKGRLLNLFPTKVDLMLAVGRHVWRQDEQHVRGISEKLGTSQGMFLALIDIFWPLMSAPTGVALLEILVACRSDKALAARFVPEHRQVHEQAIAALQDLLTATGLADRIDARAFHSYLEATIRGLVIDRVFTHDPSTPPAALKFARDEIVRICAMDGIGGVT